MIWDLGTWPAAPVERVPMLAPEQRQAYDVGEARFRDLNTAAEQKYSLPEGWLAAMEYRESGFNEHAFRVERHLVDGVMVPIISASGRPLTGVGVLQITNDGLKGRHTDGELFDPALNIDIAARYIAFLREKCGDDFPRVSASFNAGSCRPDPSNPWNLHQTAGHVTTEVSALNYHLQRGQDRWERELTYLEGVAIAGQFNLTDDLGLLEPNRRPTDPAPPNDPRDAITVPDVATIPKREDET